MHVLIVEDDVVMQELLATLLRGLDNRVYIHIAETLEAALSLWQKNPIDLLLCDWNLPNQQTGLSLVKAVRTKDSDLPIVMITGRSDRATVTNSARYKVNEFIVKPFSPGAVMERLKPYFANHSATVNIDDAPNSATLDAFVGDVEQVLKRLSIMPGTEAALAAITHADQPSALDLAQQWQRDPAITARLIRLANSSLMTRSGRAITTLREAISAVGVDMALTQVLALSLSGKPRLQHAPLQTLAQQFSSESQQLAECAALLAKQLKLNVANCYTAGLMVRLGDCAVLDAIQLYIDSGGEASDDDVASALKKYAAEYGNQLKIKWRLPLALRERIGATYSTASGQVNPELLLMRLAACITLEGEHTQEQEKLCRQLRLTPDDLPGSHHSEPPQKP